MAAEGSGEVGAALKAQLPGNWGYRFFLPRRRRDAGRGTRRQEDAREVAYYEEVCSMNHRRPENTFWGERTSDRLDLECECLVQDHAALASCMMDATLLSELCDLVSLVFVV